MSRIRILAGLGAVLIISGCASEAIVPEGVPPSAQPDAAVNASEYPDPIATSGPPSVSDSTIVERGGPYIGSGH